MLSAVFLDGCMTVHDYKNKIEALSKAAGRKLFEYQIAECYVMKYEDFIYLCNHLNERRNFFKQNIAEGGILQVSLFYCTRADKVLLVHTKKNGIAGSIAVLYNNGKKVVIAHGVTVPRINDFRKSNSVVYKKLLNML